MNIFVINLENSVERRNFQQEQLFALKLDFEFLDAISTTDVSTTIHKQYCQDWQRPLKATEVACYFSHRCAWNKVIQSNQPALILEDDALLSKCVPELLANLSDKKSIDLVNLENRSRKKFISKSNVLLECNSKLLRLYQDRTGAAGYILYPNGAKKLIQCEKRKGIALADAHITACNSIKAYQVEPAPIIQLDQCNYYGLNNIYPEKIFTSTIDNCNNLQGNLYFRIKRVYFQIKLGLRQLLLITKSERRYVKLKKEDFLQK
ncbi:glycosyl transferase, family 25 [Candidatus Ruthia magnifica str. Cm (Calyptogena magnifica)]|uniref:Glycosyl transferase, family 25 n=1 Tax=Ruthia magnifica subsp. Calyptogena magnifica TaxID=413404 RepID=A1AXG3_RUTMC|nr:glycosyltransferase family 25 protein [Candidatus Ruthturnera calyptogenae]ABL02620.1 glycosyl transferase, family 25 [Candidatus Ruthia magnifica str. Cm (Calyptogena magnifica)]